MKYVVSQLAEFAAMPLLAVLLLLSAAGQAAHALGRAISDALDDLEAWR
jgi:hypothetical protein